jgi:hypothetical protein
MRVLTSDGDGMANAATASDDGRRRRVAAAGSWQARPDSRVAILGRRAYKL